MPKRDAMDAAMTDTSATSSPDPATRWNQGGNDTNKHALGLENCIHP